MTESFFAYDWHPTLTQLPGMIKKHHHILKQDQELRNLFKEPLTVAFGGTKTVRSQIIKNDILTPQKKVVRLNPEEDIQSSN